MNLPTGTRKVPPTNMADILHLQRNTTGRDILVGDVHGHFTKLAAALKAINFDSAVDRLISVGDLVDRGPESELVTEWLGQPWLHAVRGNHEQWALELMAGYANVHSYAANGGSWFIGMDAANRRLVADLFEAMPLAIELETAEGLVVVVHADMPHTTWAGCKEALRDAGERQSAIDQMMWGRARLEQTDDVHGRVEDVRAIVHGHTVVDRYTTLDNVHYIDSGAWLPPHRGPRDFILLDAATLTPIKFDTNPSLQWS